MVQGVGKKLNTPLLFSAHLDVRPYLSSTVLQKRFTAKRPPERRKNGLSEDSDEVSVIYELYAVVCHRGNLQVRCNYSLPLSGFTVGLQGIWLGQCIAAGSAFSLHAHVEAKRSTNVCRGRGFSSQAD